MPCDISTQKPSSEGDGGPVVPLGRPESGRLRAVDLVRPNRGPPRALPSFSECGGCFRLNRDAGHIRVTKDRGALASAKYTIRQGKTATGIPAAAAASTPVLIGSNNGWPSFRFGPFVERPLASRPDRRPRHSSSSPGSGFGRLNRRGFSRILTAAACSLLRPRRTL